jgi:hypothetical protein
MAVYQRKPTTDIIVPIVVSNDEYNVGLQSINRIEKKRKLVQHRVSSQKLIDSSYRGCCQGTMNTSDEKNYRPHERHGEERLKLMTL